MKNHLKFLTLIMILLVCLETTIILFTSCSNEKNEGTHSNPDQTASSSPLKPIDLINLPIEEAERELQSQNIELFYIESNAFQTKEEAIQSFLDSNRFSQFEIEISLETLPIGVSNTVVYKNFNISDTWLLTEKNTIYALYGSTTRSQNKDVISLLKSIGCESTNILTSPTVLSIPEKDGAYRLTFLYNDITIQVLAYLTGNSQSWENLLPLDFIIFSNNFDTSFPEETFEKETVNEIVPFSKEEINNLTIRDNWRDNGIFSSYYGTTMCSAKSWKYIGTTSDQLSPNPYSFNGYDVYVVTFSNNEISYFFVPYSQYVTTPNVYFYNAKTHTMILVFANGIIMNLTGKECFFNDSNDTLCGTWWDMDSQRCNISINKITNEKYFMIVSWGNNSSSTTKWFMPLTYSEDTKTYQYDKAVCREYIYENNVEYVVTNYIFGSGSISLSGNTLYWNDNEEEIRNGCNFEKTD